MLPSKNLLSRLDKGCNNYALPNVDGSSRVRHRWQPFAGLFAILFGVLALVGWFLDGEILFVVVGIAAMVAVPFICAEFLKTIEKSAPISVQSDGIHTYDGMGSKAFVRWSQIKRVRNMWLSPGLKWLLLDDGRGYIKLAGIPVFIKERSAFYREVVKAVGEDHIVSKALRENGFGS